MQVTLQVPGWLLISENAISRTGSKVCPLPHQQPFCLAQKPSTL